MASIGELANLVNDLANDDTDIREQQTKMAGIAENIADLNHLTLKDLDVVQQLGRGSYGDVFLVRVLDSGEQLAMKVVSMMNEEPAHTARTLLEVRTLHASKCEHVVNFRGAFVDDSDVHLLMELMAMSLDGMIELVQGGLVPGDDYHVPEEVLAEVALAMVSAMRYLKKEHSLMHRDLKPANVLVNRGGETKLCDLGISKVLTNSVTKTEVGSKAYMSPERLTQPVYDIRADVWSVGMVLVELATGVYPYAHLEQPLKILTAIAEGESPSLPDALGYSDDCRDFVALCLMHDVNDRPKPKKLLKHPFLKKAAKADGKAVVADFLASRYDAFRQVQGVDFDDV